MEATELPKTSAEVPDGLAKAKPRFDPTRIFVEKDRLVWFWFGFAMLILVGAAIDRFALIHSLKQTERVIVIDPSNTFYVAPLLKFEEAKAGPLTPEVAAEVEKQKAATQALLTESQRMSFIINQLANVIPATTQVAQENDQLKAEMAATQTRLEILEDQFRQAQAQATFSPPTIPSGKGTNDW